MRRTLHAPLLMMCVACLLATPAHAGVGMALRWDRCAGDAGVVNKNFACDVNTGSEALVGSFMLSVPSPGTAGLEIVLTLASASPTVPAWWQFRNAGTCRTSSLGMALMAPPNAVHCADWAPLGDAAGGIGAYTNYSGTLNPNMMRLLAVAAVPSTNLSDLVTDQEYFAFQFNLNHAKTTGTGACGGCTTPMCLLLQKIDVVTPTTHQALSTWWMSPDDLFATWQGGAGVTTTLGSGCPLATPTRNATWSGVKALYH